MSWTNPLFIIPLAAGPLYMLIGSALLKFPRPDINFIIGYRTKSSMKSQERWDFAQRFSAREMINSGAFCTTSTALGLIIEAEEVVGVIIAITIVVGFALLPIARTEIALRSKFDKNRKS
jgi:uncharacterized membrane protein